MLISFYYGGVLSACIPIHHCLPIACEGHNTLSYPLELEFRPLQATMWCWELNLSRLEEQPVLLTTELSPQPQGYSSQSPRLGFIYLFFD